MPRPALVEPPLEWRPLGLAEVAFVFSVGVNTPQRWKYLHERTGFPLPDGYTSATVPYWHLATLRAWDQTARRKRWPGDEVALERMRVLRERDAARRAEDEARIAAIEEQAAALREVTERRAEAARARERLAEVQQELQAAEAAAAAAERRAAEPAPAAAAV